MSNRGIGRARMFVGGFLLAAAVIVWGTGVLLSPHGDSGARDSETVSAAVVIFLRNSAYATLALAAVSAVLLFPTRRPRAPRRDWAVGILIAVLIASSLYQLLWLRAAVVS